MVIPIYEILLKIPGAFKLYLFLRRLIYTKRPPRTYQKISLSDDQLLSETPKIELTRDAHGLRVQYGSDLPVSSLYPRENIEGSGNDFSYTISGNAIRIDAGGQVLEFSFFENERWTKMDISHTITEAYGLAEKHGPLNKMGKEYDIWNVDVADMEPKDDPLYKNYPILLLRTDTVWLAFIMDYPGFQKWDLSTPDRMSIHLKGKGYEFDLLVADTPKSLMRKVASVLGKMELPPRWSLGYHQCRWSYFPADRVREIAHEFRSREIPCDALYLDIDYMDEFKVFTYDKDNFGDMPQLIEDLHEQDFKVVTMIDPGIKQQEGYHVYDQGEAKDFFVRNPDGSTYTAPVWPGKSVFPDYFRNEVREWWGGLYEEFVKDYGIDGFWNDMNEPSTFTMRGTMPDDKVHTLDDGTVVEHEQVHNLFGQMMVKGSYEGLKQLNPNKRIFLLSRSAYLGSQQYGWIWSGDNRSAWSHLQESIPKIMGTGLAGHFANGPDIGGFRKKASPELYARWIQLGVFYPFMRTHNIKFTEKQEPWTFGEEVETIARSMIKLRYRLMPYIYTYFREGCVTGIPLMRPMWMEFPKDKHCYHVNIVNAQFMFGPSLLVAPVIEQGQTLKVVYLPEGKWYDFHTGKTYQGGRTHTVAAPLDKINIFVKEKTIIPVYKKVGPNMEKTVASGIEYLTFGEDATGEIYLDDGSSFDYTTNKFGLYKITADKKLELLDGDGFDQS